MPHLGSHVGKRYQGQLGSSLTQRHLPPPVAPQLAPCSPPFSYLLPRDRGAHCHLSPRPWRRPIQGGQRVYPHAPFCQALPPLGRPSPSTLYQIWTPSRCPGLGMPAPHHASPSPCSAQPSALALNSSHCPSGMPSASAGLQPHIRQGNFLQGY